MKNIQSKVMTDEEIRKYIAIYQENKSEAALMEIVSGCIAFVVSKVKLYANRGQFESDDFMSAGISGLIHAVEKFDLSCTNRFITYASHWVMVGIRREYHKTRSVVVRPVNYQQKVNKLSGVDGWIDYSDEQLAEYVGVSVKCVRKMKSDCQADVSLDHSQDEDNSNSFVIGDKDSQFHKMETDEIFGILNQKISGLSKIMQDIIKTRYFSGKAVRLKKLAEKHNLSVERIRQLERDAIQFLRKEMIPIAC